MSLALVRSIAEVRSALAGVRRRGASVALVPTMGALHAGHGRLIEIARGEADCLVVSLFVNPIQFNQQGDYERYPRPLDADLAFCEARRVDVVFAPSVQEMYPCPQRAFVDVAGVSEHLCGRFRPGHFRGVATVVLKLFEIVQPDRAYFGEKDAQQLAVIRRMVADLNLPVTIVPVPIVREADGLALSSRNQLLSPEQRRTAPALFQALQAAARLVENGVTEPAEVRRHALALLETQPEIRVEYFDLVDPDEMQPVPRITGPALLAAAVWLGDVRLIDNIVVKPSAA